VNIKFENQPLTAWDNLESVRLMNPVGRVPALMLEDGEVLIDSAAILDYLDEIVWPLLGHSHLSLVHFVE